VHHIVESAAKSLGLDLPNLRKSWEEAERCIEGCPLICSSLATATVISMSWS
jgi:hypothetical protein